MSLAHEIIYGTTEGVEHLLQSGVDLNGIDEYGFTPLVEATIMRKVDVVNLLMEKGADVDRVDSVGRTALHWAVETCQMELIQTLLEQGADTNIHSSSGQSLLVFPILRKQKELIDLLCQYGADRLFAEDYIMSKLLAHRFDLKFRTHILSPQKEFVLLNLEGFYLEFTIGVIQQSFDKYMASGISTLSKKNSEKITQALSHGSELIRYQQYPTDYTQYIERISDISRASMYLIPATYQGHAITFIKYANYLAKIDRGANSKFEGSIVIYEIGKPRAFNLELLCQIIYKKNTDAFMHKGINQFLDLKRVGTLPISGQAVGNCSWANVESALPVMRYLLLGMYTRESEDQAMAFYENWREWDKNNALDDTISLFKAADKVRKASIAALLASVLFQSCKFEQERDMIRAKKIMEQISAPEYQYIIKSYLNTYYTENLSDSGLNLMKILDYLR